MSIKIGSRKSHLAVVQAEKVRKAIESTDSSIKTELFLKSSFGDLNLDMDLSTTENKGVFTKDLLESLQAGECDLVVHSWKDLPVEQIKETKISGTLEREDSRDLFFIKKKSLKETDWTILTSSPRREFNIASFFNFLTDDEKDIRFKTIRGNIPTRFLKFLEDEEASGFCVALAAVKRLRQCEVFNLEYPDIWEKLSEACSWAVLPESYCPSAAAQGAIAIEVLKKNKEVNSIVESFNKPEVMECIEEERAILKTHGGGCHLALGVTVLKNTHGKLTFKAGNIEGREFRETTFISKKAYPKKMTSKKVWISAEEVMAKRSLVENIENIKGPKSFVVTKGVSFQKELFNTEEDLVFSSGIPTWKKLYQLGIWVNGCLDNLGSEMYLKDLLDENRQDVWLTREGVLGPEGFKTLHTYKLETELDPDSFKGKEVFAWMSGELLTQSLQDFPVLRTKKHFVGMGRSYDHTKKFLEQNPELEFEGFELHAFYNIKQFRKDLIK